MRIARVFPRKTALTPDDPLSFVGDPPPGVEVDAVEISVAFKYDIPEAERLLGVWSDIAPVAIGGPALGDPGGDFVPGRYVKKGGVITSRGCPNRCPHCSVWRREGKRVRELPIREGWNVLDDNLLACSKEHVEAVFEMLYWQKHQPSFTGGLEAAKLLPWHVEHLNRRKPESVFFAYDTPDDLEPLVEAGKLLYQPGLGLTRDGERISNRMRCYVLVGFPLNKDTPEKALVRMEETVRAGFWPMAMVFRPEDAESKYEIPEEWTAFQRHWVRLPAVKIEARLRGWTK